jgi:DNA-binding NarL/FixJ family response regulator
MMLKDTINRLDVGYSPLPGERDADGDQRVDNFDDAVLRLRDQQREAARRLACLTKREREVMQLVTSGLPNKNVARQLQLSVKTVEKHRGRLMKKLRLHSMCELFRFWFVLTWDEMLHSERLAR